MNSGSVVCYLVYSLWTLSIGHSLTVVGHLHRSQLFHAYLVKSYVFGLQTLAQWDIKAPGFLNFLGLKGTMTCSHVELSVIEIDHDMPRCHTRLTGILHLWLYFYLYKYFMTMNDVEEHGFLHT
jgi:hypothetical protein